jgi:4-hydroxyphenylpyruvate dioxygenase
VLDMALRPVEVLGTAFIEFAGPDPLTLVGALKRLGFEALGQRRGTLDTWLRHGQVDFVVNSLPGTHADRFAQRHGPSIAGMAFSVPHGEQAIQQALALGAHMHGASERTLCPGRALVGIGDSALYLVDQADLQRLAAEFGVGEGPVAAPGYTRVDHVTHCVHRGEMVKWVEFYRLVFGFRPVFDFGAGDAADGFDTVAMRSSGDTACVTVVEPKGPASQIQHFIDDYRGEGIQHVALGVEDLCGCVERRLAAGVEFLPASPSYYETLYGRQHGLNWDLHRLRRLNILLDAPHANAGTNRETASLLQIFTRRMIGPIFFELIERNWHDGFGDGNAQALFDAIKRDQIVE